MKVKGKKLLAAMLSLAMVLSMFVVPAAAVDPQPGEVGYKWDFCTDEAAKDKNGDAYQEQVSYIETDRFDGLTFSANGAKYHSKPIGIQLNDTVTITVPGNCDIEVAVNNAWNLQLGEDATTRQTMGDGSSSPLTFHYTGEAGTVVLKTAADKSYINSITLKTATAAPPTLTLDKEAVSLKLVDGPTSATVTATVGNKADAVVEAVSKNTSVATVAVAGNVVTITAAGKGTTDVDVTVADTDLKKTVAVEVEEAGTVTHKEWDFTSLFYKINSGANSYKGLTLSGVTWHGTTYGSQAQGGTYGIPVTGPCTIKVSVGYNWDVYMAQAKDHNTAAASYKDNTNSGDIDVDFVYEGEAGTVTLTTGTSFKSYVKKIKLVYPDPVTPDPGPGETGSVEAGTIDFQALASNVTPTETINNNSYGAVPTVEGLTVGSDAVLQTNSSHGLYAKSNGVTVTLNLSGAAKITLVECQYGANKISKVTAGGTDVTLPTPTGETDKTYVFEDVSAGNFVLTLNAGAYIHSIKVEYPTTPEPGPEPEPEPGNGKVDVYDFGAEALDTAKFNNKLTAADINAWYPGVAAGTASTALPATVTTGKFTYESDKTNTRLRTTNNALTHYDSTSDRCNLAAGQDPYDPTRTAYTGVICSNGGTITLKLTTGAGDKITYIMGSNAKTAYTATFTGADNSTKEAEVPAAHGAITFYAPKAGTQSLFSGVDGGNRPAVGRIYVEQPTAVTVSGNVTIDSSLADPTGLKLVFTNDDSGIATEATITGTTYTVSLSNYQAGATYTVTAEGITGGTILEGKALALTGETGETASHNVTVGQVSLVDVSGQITGLSADALGRLKLALTPPEGNAYVPEITMDGNGAWSAQLQSGVEYTVSVENVNDHTLGTAKVKYSADATDAAIAFTAKPTYAVTIVPTGLTLDELADATFTFTNVKETYEAANGKPASYVYTFTGPSAIALRDGQYSVKVTTGKGRQELTPDLKINGAVVNCPIEFDVTAPTEWDFRTADAAAMDEAASGLTLSSVSYHGSKYGSTTKGGTYGIHVPGPCTIKVSVGYNWDVYMPEATEHNTAATSYKDNTDSGDIDVEFVYEGEAGTVTLSTGSQFSSYVKAIKVIAASSAEFKDTVTVGAGKDCATITEALELVAQMPRPNNERVTIVIDPGNYEEQLLVSVANVTLKNAKAAEAKLELKNKGVDIGDNEVRITHYYGHGYTYYSMTNGHRYSEKVLAVNKANGYPSYINTGTGNTDNSYWNTSVLVEASGFQAEGIIFENSFNQYVSAKAANDVIVPQAGAAKEPANAPRASLPQGSTAVQDKTYVERAAALVIKNNVTNVFFDKCAFIGRQDVLAGCAGVTAGFYNCDIYGGTDYIMEDMKAVFAKCNLVMNTSENKNDVAYITAAKNTGGYLMYNCSVISTVPGVNTASKLPSKPGTFGRPWEPNCEVVFYETIVDTTTTKADGTQGTEELSLIQPIGWTEGLNGGGNFQRCVEYHTHEGVDVDTSARHANVNVFDEPKRSDGSAIDYTTWLGGWNPFADKDMTVLGCPDTSRTVTFKVSTGASVTDLAADGEAKTLDSKSKLVALKEAVITFKIALTEGYNLSSVTGATWDDDSVYTVTADTVVISASRPSSGGGDMVPTGPVGGNKGETVTNPDGSKTTTITDKKGNTTVTTVATDGSKLETVTTKDGDKTITVTDAKGEVQVKIELPATIPAPETKFVDVPESHWAESAINDMAGLGLVKGVNDDTFDMVSPITRASVATILFRLSNGAEGKTSSFTDVKAGEWYADAVAWAASTGVVNGYSETVFAPNDSITREQFAVMLYRFAKLIGMDTATSGDVSRFGDAASVSEWASDAMAWCVGEGILNGTNDPIQGIALSPAKTASRAECAVMLDRFIALI